MSLAPGGLAGSGANGRAWALGAGDGLSSGGMGARPAGSSRPWPRPMAAA